MISGETVSGSGATGHLTVRGSPVAERGIRYRSLCRPRVRLRGQGG